jgi:hypothetical protein
VNEAGEDDGGKEAEHGDEESELEGKRIAVVECEEDAEAKNLEGEDIDHDDLVGIGASDGGGNEREEHGQSQNKCGEIEHLLREVERGIFRSGPGFL